MIANFIDLACAQMTPAQSIGFLVVLSESKDGKDDSEEFAKLEAILDDPNLPPWPFN